MTLRALSPWVCFASGILFALTSSCVAQRAVDGAPRSDQRTDQKTTANSACPDFEAARVNRILSQDPKDPDGLNVSDSYIKNYLEANFLFPQDNHAINIFALLYALHDPKFDFSQSVDGLALTEPQIDSLAKTVSLAHKKYGVKRSSSRFPLENPSISERRLGGLIRGSVRRTRYTLAATLYPSFFADETNEQIDSISKSNSWVQTISPELCDLVKVLTAMKASYRSPSVLALNEEWKARITSPEVIQEGSVPVPTEVYLEFRPRVGEAIFAEMRKDPLTPRETELMKRVWKAANTSL
jgi:hypothetical protein